MSKRQNRNGCTYVHDDMERGDKWLGKEAQTTESGAGKLRKCKIQLRDGLKYECAGAGNIMRTGRRCGNDYLTSAGGEETIGNEV